MKLIRRMAAGFAAGLVLLGSMAADTKEKAAGRVGVYDSRAVAYAYFWSVEGARQREALVTAVRMAKQAGDADRAKELEARLAARQKANHLQVFSTAPVDDLLREIQDRLPAIQTELGVTRPVSKWDASALKQVPEAERTDVTDRLVRTWLEPTTKQHATIESIKAAKPVALWKAKLLVALHMM